jgi:RNA polymerase sigma-70 factor (ECF subfamily)
LVPRSDENKAPEPFCPPRLGLAGREYGGFFHVYRINPFGVCHRRSVCACSDEILVERIAAGDKHAMQVLFARHRTPVYRWLLRFVGNETVAEDLLSDVFFDVWQQAGRFEGRSAVTTWLLSIARFKALSARRRRTHTEQLNEVIEATVADSADTADVVLEKKHQGEMLRDALTKLSPEHREIIDLVYYHEKSVDDAAQILSIPSATVKTRMFYARKKLAELVQGA